MLILTTFKPTEHRVRAHFSISIISSIISDRQSKQAPFKIFLIITHVRLTRLWRVSGLLRGVLRVYSYVVNIQVTEDHYHEEPGV